jgi:hypothetical protein
MAEKYYHIRASDALCVSRLSASQPARADRAHAGPPDSARGDQAGRSARGRLGHGGQPDRAEGSHQGAGSQRAGRSASEDRHTCAAARVLESAGPRRDGLAARRRAASGLLEETDGSARRARATGCGIRGRARRRAGDCGARVRLRRHGGRGRPAAWRRRPRLRRGGRAIPPDDRAGVGERAARADDACRLFRAGRELSHDEQPARARAPVVAQAPGDSPGDCRGPAGSSTGRDGQAGHGYSARDRRAVERREQWVEWTAGWRS